VTANTSAALSSTRPQPFDPTAEQHLAEMVTVAQLIQDRDWIPNLRATTGIKDDQVFMSDAFLQGSQDRYRTWIRFVQAHPEQEQEIHPTYAMDVLWHAHMLNPVHYAFSCDVAVGHLLDHSPWPEETPETLSQRLVNSRSLWEEFCGQRMADPWWESGNYHEVLLEVQVDEAHAVELPEVAVMHEPKVDPVEAHVEISCGMRAVELPEYHEVLHLEAVPEIAVTHELEVDHLEAHVEVSQISCGMRAVEPELAVPEVKKKKKGKKKKK